MLINLKRFVKAMKGVGKNTCNCPQESIWRRNSIQILTWVFQGWLHPQIICTTTRRIVPSFGPHEIIPLIVEEALEVKGYFFGML